MANYVEPIKSKQDLKNFLCFLKKNYYKYYVIFQIGMMTGLRISDILALNIEDVYDKESFEVIEKKTKKHKKMLLQENTQKIIKTYIEDYRIKQYSLENDNPLFVGKQHNRLDRSQVYRIFKKAVKACGIPITIGTHTMRKTFGYHHYQQFKDVVLLQKILNHSSPSITLRYIGIYQEEIDDSYKRFNLLNDLQLVSSKIIKENNKEVRIVELPPKNPKKLLVYKSKIIKSDENKKIKDVLNILENVSCSGSKNSKFARFLLDYIKDESEV